MKITIFAHLFTGIRTHENKYTNIYSSDAADCLIL